jgi:hypothetical protein
MAREYVTLMRAADPKEARLAFQLLESNGFHPWMPGGHEHTYVQLDTTIQIPEDEREAAEAVIDAYGGREPDGADSDDDPDSA